MTRTIGLIHAVIPAMPPLRTVLADELPDVRVLNLLDEALLREAERLGGITPALVRRVHQTQAAQTHPPGAGASRIGRVSTTTLQRIRFWERSR